MHPSHTKCLSAETLSDYIGERSAAIIVQHYGGTTIKIPVKPAGTLFAAFCQQIGEEAALHMLSVFSGERLYVAMNERALRQSMAREVMRMRAEGMSFDKIAAVFRGPPKRYTPSGLLRLVRRVKEGQT